MSKIQSQLLPSSVSPNLATIAVTPQEVAFHVGARTVSWYHGGRHHLGELEAYTLDVARAVAAHVVDELVTYLAADLPPVTTPEVAESEWLRLQERMDEWSRDYAHAVDAAARALVADDAPGHTDAVKRAVAREALLHKAALQVSAALLRARAVRW